MRPLPTGTVTFLFTDIEGSTRLLHELGDAYAEALAEHRRLLREAFTRHGGVEVDTQGDAFFVAFARAKDAVAAAAEAQRAMAAGPIRVRMGIHTGEPIVSEEGYIGVDVHRGARIADAGHGGQVLISQTTGDLLDSAVELHDLGAHRLKDLTEAQRLYQLGDGEFPPPRTLHQTNLPVQPTPLIGREQELEEVLELLSRTRLLTLTGAGGSGKTRLALQAAAELVEDYPQGVWWVALAALRDPELVEPMIAQVVSAKDGLAEHLRSQRTLLLLDNFERVLPAAPRIAAMLAEAPEVRVLATSRERLGVGAEQEYPVPTMTPADAVALFSARARQLRPRFEPDATVAEICHRLDGLPLALELAAARVKVLRPEQILARLEHRLELLTTGARDAPERQRTLRAAIEWSYDLLDGGEKKLFARLAVFAGSFDLEAAEEVAEADIDTLASLVDKSLLRQTQEGRFFMLETIREYALERLDETDDGGVLRERHAGHMLALAESFEEGLLAGAELRPWLDRLSAEHDNVRAALAWAQAVVDPELELRLAIPLRPFWQLRGHVAEGRTRLEAALERGQAASPQLRAKAQWTTGVLAYRQLDLAAARRLWEESLTLYEALGDRTGLGRSLGELGLLAIEEGDDESAAALYERAAAIFRDDGDDRRLAVVVTNLGGLALTRGDYGEAERQLEASLELVRKVGDDEGMAESLRMLGSVAIGKGAYARARDLFTQSLGLSAEIGFPESVAYCLSGLGLVAVSDGDSARAATLLGAAEAILEEIGARMLAVEHGMHEAAVEAARRDLGEHTLAAARTAGRALGLEQAVAYALSHAEPTSMGTLPLRG